MKHINFDIIEEYYNPYWFYNMNYEEYEFFVKQYENELIKIIESKDSDELYKLCIAESILPNPDFSYYDYEFNFDDDSVSIYVENDNGGGSLTFYINCCLNN